MPLNQNKRIWITRKEKEWMDGLPTSPYLILSSYMYWGPGAFLPIFSFLVSSLTNILLPSQRFAYGKLYYAWVFSTDNGNFPNEVWACSLSRACANAVRSIKFKKAQSKQLHAMQCTVWSENSVFAKRERAGSSHREPSSLCAINEVQIVMTIHSLHCHNLRLFCERQ